jgi:hypothetical protein
MGETWNESARAKLAKKHTDASAPCPQPRQGGTAAHRNQQNVSRVIGGDPATRGIGVRSPDDVDGYQPGKGGGKVLPKVRRANLSRQHP